MDATTGKLVLQFLTLLCSSPISIAFLLVILAAAVVPAWLVSMAMTNLRDEVKQQNAEANQRYENNVILVEDYKKLVKNYERLTDELLIQIRLSTEVSTELKTIIRERKP